MAASTNDKFKKVGASTVTTLAAPGKALAASSINVGSTTNYPTDTGIVIAIRVVDSNGDLVAGTYTEWNATVASGTSLSISTTPRYGSDQVYAAGSTTQVFIPVSSSAHEDLIDGLVAEHNQDGTHSDITADSVTTNSGGSVDFSETPLATTDIDDDAITTDKIADGAVTYDKLLSTIFSGAVTSGTATGTAAGSYNLLNLGGIKLAWGFTNSVNASSNKTIILPSFFTTIQAGVITPSATYNNTNVMTANWATVLTSQTTTLTFTPLIIAGSNPSNPYTWFVIGN